MVVTSILLDKHLEEHKRYIKIRSKYPFPLFDTDKNNRNKSEQLFEEIINLKEKSEETIEVEKKDWISEATHQLFKEKSAARRRHDSEKIKSLGRLVQKSLRKDRNNRVNETAYEAEAKLKCGDVRGAYKGMQKWYRDNPEITTNPTRDDIDKIQNEFKTLYSKNENKEEILKTYVKYNIKDDTPGEEEIIKSLKKLRNGKAPGASGISVDEIKSWYKRARVLKEEKVDEKAIKLWESVIEIIQIAFRTGEVPMAFKRGTLVLIPKAGSNDFRGIALLETIYKIVSMIIHKRLIESIQFHDSIHGFRTERGTSTAIINIKLKMQLAKRRKIPLYMIFLDIKKAYDTIDRERVIILLKKYGLGDNIIKLMENIWDKDTVIPKTK